MMYRDFWAAGLRIIGIHPVTKDRTCGCGQKDCDLTGKHVIVSNWQHTPVWSEEQLETFELLGHYETGYGVLCKGILVVDVDARNGGVASLQRLLNDIPAIELAGLVVDTGSGGGSCHFYFKVPEGLALRSHHEDYPGVDFKSTGFVIGPGSLHKSGNLYTVRNGSVEDITDAPAELIDLLRKPERFRAQVEGAHVDVSENELGDMLSYVTNDDGVDYEKWIRVGMALHHASGGTAYNLWLHWSSTSGKHDPRQMPKKWHSFGKSANPVTLATLIHYAQQGGWVPPVEFKSDMVFEEPAPEKLAIDLLRPPGFVGRVAAWCETQNRYPREHLSVAAALTAMGNILGLRYTDDLDRVATNFFTFFVAGSATGKEGVQNSVTALHKAAGVHPAAHGTIKSEQEIVRNLVDHQASLYVIDEIGYLLGKIKNAQAKGGAAYLDGIIGMLMSAYGKANSCMLVSGDMKKTIRADLLKEMGQLERRMEEAGETPRLRSRVDSITRQLETLDDGLTRPFLSLAGFTTGAKFDSLVDYETATSGFLRRALIFREYNDTPERKKSFNPPELPFDIEMTLRQLYHGDSYDSEKPLRVEYYGEKAKIPTTPEAARALDEAGDRLHAMAEQFKDTVGLEAIALGAYELVAKVSFILGAPEGLRTLEHVQWAEALVTRDVRIKARMVIGNERQKDDPAMALRARIEVLIAGEQGETLGMIVNRLRPAKKADIEKMLDIMVKAGAVEVEEYTSKYNKRKVARYKMVKVGS